MTRLGNSIDGGCGGSISSSSTENVTADVTIIIKIRIIQEVPRKEKGKDQSGEMNTILSTLSYIL